MQKTRLFSIEENQRLTDLISSRQGKDCQAAGGRAMYYKAENNMSGDGYTVTEATPLLKKRIGYVVSVGEYNLEWVS